MNKIIALFPGQGSQKVGMGKDLLDNSAVAKRYFSIADDVLGFSLTKICLEGPADALTATAVAQPAILTVSTICFEIFREAVLNKGTCSVAAAAGHSLGEYSALVAAGALTFEDAVLLVHKRGKYMQEAVPLGTGKMAAVLGREVAEIEAALRTVTAGVVEIANVNSPGQVVIAGASAAVDAAIKVLGGKIMELPVSAPFHCVLMKPAEERLVKDLASVPFKPAAFPVYSNFSTAPLTAPQEIREALKLQVCGRVRWVESMERAVKETGVTKSVEFGAGSVLSGMLKRIAPAVARSNVDSVESVTYFA